MQGGGAEEIQRGGFDVVEVGELGRDERGEGRPGDFDGGDLGEVSGESAREETDSGIEVEG